MYSSSSEKNVGGDMVLTVCPGKTRPGKHLHAGRGPLYRPS
jgi:hypothetical protein